MHIRPQPTVLRAFWALLWRSVVLLPFTFAYLVLLCGAGIVWFCFPVLAVCCAWNGDWWSGVVFISIWFPVFFALHWCQRREHLEANWGPL
jgi:hypothetical protein